MIKRLAFSCFCMLLVALALMSLSSAAPELFELSWWSVDSGGGVSQGGDYALSYTIGQPEAGTLSGGIYTLEGGFGTGGTPDLLSERIFLPLIVSD